MGLKGIDISGFQSLAQLAAVIDRYDWIGVKATEGLHSSNALHAQQVALARSKGKGVLHYHFFHPNEDPRAQWAWFRSYSQWRPGDMLALDVEATDGRSWAFIAAQAAVFLATAKAATGASPWLYLNQYWRSQLAATGSARTLETFPLWLADYTRDPAKLGSAAPWPNLTCEQWTDNDHGTGIDGDVFLGDWAAWVKLAVPGVSSSSSIWKWVAAVVLAGGVGTGVASGTPAVYHPPVTKPTVISDVPPAHHPAPAPVPAKKPCGCPKTHPTGNGPQKLTYVVRRGDTLSSIAARFHTSWQHLAQVNHLAHPDLIAVGQRLVVGGSSRPAAAASTSVWVRVKAGDTLAGIAARHGTSWEHLARLNHLTHPSLIHPGQRLRVH